MSETIQDVQNIENPYLNFSFQNDIVGKKGLQPYNQLEEERSFSPKTTRWNLQPSAYQHGQNNAQRY